MAETSREIALKILTEISENGIYSHKAIHGALEKYQFLPKRDRALITRICEGTVERMIELDYIIDCFATVPTSKMKPVIRDILRSGVYQILFCDSVPDAAAVNEAVRLTQIRGFYNLKGFVNGVLRSVIRGKDEIPYPDRREEPVRYLSVTYSMPEWIVKDWLSEYGMFVTERILEAMLKERPTTVRYKTGKANARAITESMEAQGVTVRHAPYLSYAYYISDFNYLPALNAFKEGWIWPQDVASMLVGEAAGPNKGDTIFDLCAAPGGKSLHLADKMENYGMVEARDLTEEKVALIRENIRRSNLVNIRTQVMDALVFDPDSEERADIVICDLPCSGLGVAGRKADIKYRITEEKIDALAELQKEILKNAVRYVRPGGHLIYSTCTISSKENTGVREWALKNLPLEAESLDPFIPKILKRLTTEEGYLQLLPGIHDTDGFFIARFRKKSGSTHFLDI